MNISQVLSLGMHALAISGQDIGGFEQSASDDKQKWANPELVIRWTAAGAAVCSCLIFFQGASHAPKKAKSDRATRCTVGGNRQGKAANPQPAIANSTGENHASPTQANNPSPRSTTSDDRCHLANV